MEGGEGASLTQAHVKKRPLQAAKRAITKTAQEFAHRLADKLYGTEEGPKDPARRIFLKRAIGIGALTAVAVLENAAAIKALATGAELVKFADAPDFRKHEYYKTATRDAQHVFTDSAVFEDKDGNGNVTRRYVPTGYISFGDSLAWGLVEEYDAHNRLIVDLSRIQRCPTDTLCTDMNDAGVKTLYPIKSTGGEETANQPLDVDFEALNFAFPGATIDDIAGQIQRLSKDLGDHPEQYPPIAFDAILAIGGNNALDYLGTNLSFNISTLDLADRFKTEFIEGEFKPQMRALIKGILALRTQGKDKPFLDNMKHLIVSGVPNLGASDQLYYIPSTNKKIEKPEDIPPAQAIPMVPGLKGLATAACQYMNSAILDVIKEVQDEVRLTDPTFGILFEDIFDVPMHGIHPTEEGYRQIAAKRERRSRAQFYIGPPNKESEMTYSQYIARSQQHLSLSQGPR